MREGERERGRGRDEEETGAGEIWMRKAKGESMKRRGGQK